jgi:hypothetical protein
MHSCPGRAGGAIHDRSRFGDLQVEVRAADDLLIICRTFSARNPKFAADVALVGARCSLPLGGWSPR